MFKFMKNLIPGRAHTTNLQTIRTLADVMSFSRPILRKEDLLRLEQTHSSLEREVHETRNEAVKLAATLSSELEKARRTNATILDSMMDALISLDCHGNVLEINSSAERLLGFTNDELVGKPSSSFLLGRKINAASLFDEGKNFVRYMRETCTEQTPFITRKNFYRLYVQSKNTELNKVHSLTCCHKTGKVLDINTYVNVLNIDVDNFDNLVFIAVLKDMSEQVAANAVIDNLTQLQLGLLSAMPNPVFYKGADLKFLGANAAFCKLMEMRPDMILGKTSSDIFPPSTASVLDSVDELLHDAERADVNTQNLIVFGSRTKTPHNIALYSAAVRDKAGAFSGTVGTMVDLTELLSVQRFQTTLMESVKNPVYYLYRDLRYCGCNLAYETLIGLSRDQIIGRTRVDVLNMIADNAACKLTEYQSQFASGLAEHNLRDTELTTGLVDSQTYELRIPNAITGEIRDAVAYRSALRNVSGEFDGVLCLLTDVTNLKTAERFHQRIFDATPIPIYYKDKDSKYVMCNQAFADLFLTTKEELIGKTVLNVHDLVRAGARSLLSETLFEQESHFIGVLSTMHQEEQQLLESGYCNVRSFDVSLWSYKHREAREMVVYHSVLCNAEGKPEGFIGSFVDVTELRRASTLHSALTGSLDRHAVCFFDSSLLVNSCNEAFEQLIGLSKEELLGMSISDQRISAYTSTDTKPHVIQVNGKKILNYSVHVKNSANSLVGIACVYFVTSTDKTTEA